MDKQEEFAEIRKAMVKAINAFPGTKEELKEAFKDVYDTKELMEKFEVEAFYAPIILVTRKEDGKKGTLLFQHSPRFYFAFEELK